MSSGLVPDWDGGLIDFNSEIEFKCQNGQKFLNDFGKTSQKFSDNKIGLSLRGYTN